MKEGTKLPGPLRGSLLSVTTTPGQTSLSCLPPPAFLLCLLLSHSPVGDDPCPSLRSQPPQSLHPVSGPRVVPCLSELQPGSVCFALIPLPWPPGPPLRVNDLTLGHGAEGMCAKSSPQGTRGCLQSGRWPR